MMTQSISIGSLHHQPLFHNSALKMHRTFDHAEIAPRLFELIQVEVARSEPFLAQVFEYPSIALETLIAKVLEAAAFLFGIDFSLSGDIKALECAFRKTTHPIRRLELMGEIALFQRHGINVAPVLHQLKVQLPEELQQSIDAGGGADDQVAAILNCAKRYTSFIERRLKQAESQGNWAEFLLMLGNADNVDTTLQPKFTRQKALEYWKKLPQPVQAASHRFSGPVTEDNVFNNALELAHRLPSNQLQIGQMEFFKAMSVDQQEEHRLHCISQLKQSGLLTFTSFDISEAEFGACCLEMFLQLKPVTQQRVLDTAHEFLQHQTDGWVSLQFPHDVPASLDTEKLTLEKHIAERFDSRYQEQLVPRAVEHALANTDLT